MDAEVGDSGDGVLRLPQHACELSVLLNDDFSGKQEIAVKPRVPEPTTVEGNSELRKSTLSFELASRGKFKARRIVVAAHHLEMGDSVFSVALLSDSKCAEG